MPFDFKKEYKELYLPSVCPVMIEMAAANYIAVRGKGDPNAVDSDYKNTIELLYGVAYTLKMSKMGEHKLDGYYDYVVPPLEGLWWSEHGMVDYSNKDDFCFISMIRLPDFVKEEDVEWAKATASQKKKKEVSIVEFFRYDEGMCVQCMHIGSYDDEPVTIGLLLDKAMDEGYELDVKSDRKHHEIYLSDPRKTAPDKLKTVIRLPIRRIKD